MSDTDLSMGWWYNRVKYPSETFSPRMRLQQQRQKQFWLAAWVRILHVPVSQLEVKDGIIRDIRNSNNKVSSLQKQKN